MRESPSSERRRRIWGRAPPRVQHRGPSRRHYEPYGQAPAKPAEVLLPSQRRFIASHIRTTNNREKQLISATGLLRICTYYVFGSPLVIYAYSVCITDNTRGRGGNLLVRHKAEIMHLIVSQVQRVNKKKSQRRVSIHDTLFAIRTPFLSSNKKPRLPQELDKVIAPGENGFMKVRLGSYRSTILFGAKVTVLWCNLRGYWIDCVS